MRDYYPEATTQDLWQAYRETLFEVGGRFNKNEPCDPDDFDLGQYVSDRAKSDGGGTFITSLLPEHFDELKEFFQSRGRTELEAVREAISIVDDAQNSREGGTNLAFSAPWNDDVEENWNEIEPGWREGQPKRKMEGLVQCVTHIPAPEIAGGPRAVLLTRIEGIDRYTLLWESIQWALGEGYAAMCTRIERTPENEGWIESLTECGFESIGSPNTNPLLLRRPLYDLEYRPIVFDYSDD
jgi:hypothetical protein